MKLPRRRFLRLAAVTVALPVLSRTASALDYPSRPVRIVIGFTAGGTADILGRLLAQALSQRLGQQFIIENRPGASSNVATSAVAHSAPDGYTLLLVTQANAINATLYDNLNFNFVRDFVPVASTTRVPQVMEVNPAVPAETIPEFIAYAKANPNKLNMASSGSGAASHVAGELFKMMAGIEMLHVPYRGSPFPDLFSGRVQVYFSPIPSSIEFIRTRKLRAVAVTTAARSEALPDISSVSEFIPGYEASGWYGVVAPKNTPAEIVEKLNKEMNTVLADPAMIARLAELGGSPFSGTPAEFSKLIADETEKWAKVIRSANIKPD
jgi:tripartite-type tricarboxylate transporter receptor subunit TctC